MSGRRFDIPGRFAAPPDAVVSFEGKPYAARHGEPLVATLHAHGVRVLGRSGKYHRARGLSCGRGVCGTCVARIDGVPNERLCVHSVTGNDEIEVQNVLGSARHDLLASIDVVFREGLDHHHLMTESVLLNQVTVKMARRLAGLGTLPSPKQPQSVPPYERQRVDVAVVGGGPAGVAAADTLRAAGLSLLVLDDQRSSDTIRRGRVLGLYDEHELLVVDGVQQLRLSARAYVVATGALEVPPACSGNDLPGVLSLSAAELLLRHGVSPGRRVMLALAPDVDAGTRARAEQVARDLGTAHVPLVAVLNAPNIPAEQHIDGVLGGIEGDPEVERVRIADEDRGYFVDTVIYAGRPVPALELARQMGVPVRFDGERRAFVPEVAADGSTARPNVFLAGEVAGLDRANAAAHGVEVSHRVLRFVRGAA